MNLFKLQMLIDPVRREWTDVCERVTLDELIQFILDTPMMPGEYRIIGYETTSQLLANFQTHIRKGGK